MHDTDEVTPELRDLLTAAPVPPAPPLDAITARGRARRRHRRGAVVGLSLAGATAATAVGLNLGTSSSPARTPVANHPVQHSPTNRTVSPDEIRTAAFTLVRHADGTVTLTIDPTELFDPKALESDLEQDGIPARVTPGKICSSDPAPGDVSPVVVWHPHSDPDGHDTITIDPSAMPTGSELSFGILPLKLNAEAAQFTLIDPNAFTCSKTALNDAPPRTPHGGVFRIPPSN